MNRNVCANRSRKSFFDEIDLTCSRLLSRFAHRTFLYLGNSRWNTDHHTWTNQRLAFMHFCNKISDHFFDGFKIGNNTIFHRTNSNDVARSTSKHSLCFMSHRKNLACARLNRNNRRFTKHYSLTFYMYQSICCSEVNPHIIRKQSVKRIKHLFLPRPQEEYTPLCHICLLIREG